MVENAGLFNKEITSFPDVHDLLEGYRELPDNWDGYQALPPSPSAIYFTRGFLMVLERRALLSGLNIRPPDMCVPMADKGMSLNWDGKNDLYIELSPIGLINYISKNPIGEEVIRSGAQLEELLKQAIVAAQSPKMDFDDKNA